MLQLLSRGGGSVWSHDPFFAHLGMNPKAYTQLKDQDYLVFDLTQDAKEYTSPPIRALVNSGAYSLDVQNADMAILRKRGATSLR